ncbi:hypothetical protein SAMN04490247_3044 [Salimicrobium halophilum]|uniref:Uncharacterized protein n=1 Tax=Salimicrobium halophilum TaxID=86666 RepID=A0A1G8W5S9_9BACI|nr:hypothetical protein SAMN04490247_3044 [Salimicrobium halophilum]
MHPPIPETSVYRLVSLLSEPNHTRKTYLFLLSVRILRGNRDGYLAG